MSGIKVKIIVEPGDAAADLKLELHPGDGPDEETVMKVGGGILQGEQEYDLELGSTVLITVENVRRVKYDAQQMMNVEMTAEDTKKEVEKEKKEKKDKEEAEKKDRERRTKEEQEAAKEAEPKSAGAYPTGAKEGAHEGQTRYETENIQGARGSDQLPGRSHKDETPKPKR